MSSNVEPFVKTTSRTIVRFSVECKRVNLFNDATLVVDSFDENQNVVDRTYITLTSEQYLAWNNDDSYIINLVASTLGYTVSQ